MVPRENRLLLLIVISLEAGDLQKLDLSISNAKPIPICSTSSKNLCWNVIPYACGWSLKRSISREFPNSAARGFWSPFLSRIGDTSRHFSPDQIHAAWSATDQLVTLDQPTEVRSIPHERQVGLVDDIPKVRQVMTCRVWPGNVLSTLTMKSRRLAARDDAVVRRSGPSSLPSPGQSSHGRGSCKAENHPFLEEALARAPLPPTTHRISPHNVRRNFFVSPDCPKI